MNIIMHITGTVNNGHPAVITGDQPVYAIAKYIQVEVSRCVWSRQNRDHDEWITHRNGCTKYDRETAEWQRLD
jgi:hypothetical protein